MRTLKLYGTGSATANAVAQVTIPSKTRLVGVQISLRVDQAADNSSAVVELSRSSASEIAVNGAQQCIAVAGMFGNGTTPQVNFNGFFPVDVSLDQGQILYLHAAVTTSTYYAELVLHYL